MSTCSSFLLESGKERNYLFLFLPFFRNFHFASFVNTLLRIHFKSFSYITLYMYYRTTGCYYDFLLKLGHTLFIFVYVSSALDSTHCYSTRSNVKQMGPLRFCLPVCIGIHRNLKQKDYFNLCEGFL